MKKTWIVIIAIVAMGSVLVGIKLTKDKSNSAYSIKRSQASQTSNLSAMQKQFEGYHGDQYDKIFLASMIVHHQGAVQMAQLARTNARHQEIKGLANNIVAAQNAEINQMQTWQTAWGYSNNDSSTQAVVKQMQSEMDSMMGSLNGKTVNDFDTAFLSAMIMHHLSAIDMSKPATTNASHEQVKILASNIMTAQTKEVNEMMQWQTQWGYKVHSNSSDTMSGMNM